MPHPWMPLYPGDFLRDTEHLTNEEIGCYFRMIILLWIRGGYLPDDDRDLARVLGYNNDLKLWRKIKRRLAPMLYFVDRQITQKRVLMELWKTDNFSKKQSEKIRKRWAKAKHINGVAHTAVIPTTTTKKDSELRSDVPSDSSQKKEVFTKGVNMLTAEGMSERQARSLVGKWRKLSGGDNLALNELLDKAVEADPAVLAEWMGAALSGKSNGKIRMVGSNYVIPPGTDQWDAWHRFFIRLNDPRVYKKGELTVPSMWPK